MPTVSFSDDDIAAGHLVEKPDWYDYEIFKVQEKPAKSDGSPNYFVSFRGLSGEMEKVVVTQIFSSKFLAPMIPLWSALNNGAKPDKNTKFQIEEFVNCKVSAMTRRGEYNGSPQNQLSDYRPYGG